ncbi:NAD(P)-binding protein [Leucogyrophana mollusca]|uniref:NAD(P)-binding protein n=1 Tax=Leucogyrophana mollusca TaxID=85980 RepID=A0ACB8BF94_9AGAM|nr:NAD(P)-binding protein [Leucogyrophana mollusca]
MSIPKTIREYRSQGDHHTNLKLQESPLSGPKANEVLVKIHAASLQYRDLMVSKGRYPGQKKDVVPCSDMAGEIAAVGQDVTGWKVGDRVCANFALDHIHGDVNHDIQQTGLGGQIDGVLREYINVPVHSLVRVPDHLSYEEGSTLPCAALTAYNALLGPTPLKGGDFVLVLGTGGVSIFGLQLAVASGATVIATSSSDEKLEIAKKLGAHHVINYNTTPDWDDVVLKITEGKGVDHVIEVGGPGTIQKCIKAVRYAGWIHIIGFVAQGQGDLPIRAAIGKALIFRGIQIGSVKQFEDMNRLIKAHQIHPVVDTVFPFEKAIEAYSYLESQKHVGKVVIKISKD